MGNTTSNSAQQKPLSGDLPHVAYVLLWFPLFTQPFIFREVKCLREIVPMEVYTLYAANNRHLSSEMKNCGIKVTSYGARSLFKICFAVVREFCRDPRRTFRLFRENCCHKWSSFEVLGENLWAFFTGTHMAGRFREEGIDMIYAPWPRGTATAARVAAKLLDIPFAIAARGDNLEPADPDLGDKFSDALFIRANNEADRHRIEEFDHQQAKGKTELVYNSLTLPQISAITWEKKTLGQPVRLLALGRFDVTKGFDVLLEACAILKTAGFPFHLTLAGGGGKVMGLGNLEDSLRDLRGKLDLEKEVDMPGLVSHDELPRILNSHDIFVAPCVVHKSGRRDGIPNTVIEAMAYGMPVISTNINALPEVVRDGETGISVPPGDPRALADAIMKLAADPSMAARLGSNASDLANSLFDCQANARRLADVIGARYAQWRSVREGKEKCAE